MARLWYTYHTILLLLAIPFLAASSAAPSPLPPCSPLPDANTPLWNLSDWSTDYTLPDDGGTVSFRLVNALTGYGALCVRVGPYPEGYCVSGAGQGGTSTGVEEGDDDDTGTLFTYYEGVDGELSVYQEWSCGGVAGESGGTTKRIQVDGKVMVRNPSQCGPAGPGHDEMKKGEMCGLQGGQGVIYPTLVQATPTV
ncbi:hypothetical protein B0H63DRAFT_165484 [Podospora didyma]|uniref:Uncharacterized protein n=1 Tax=Podospora didyma TaxID=330526 RepID=A0AAE0NU85_9PEZI|nr:hypothetical protein B0H63DRAFT_165484 [Podospora didyma]